MFNPVVPLPDAGSGVRAYHVKPDDVAAVMLTATNGREVAAWCGGEYHSDAKPGDPSDVVHWVVVPTLLPVTVKVFVGEYLVKAKDGKFFVLNPDKFEAKYELVKGAQIR